MSRSSLLLVLALFVAPVLPACAMNANADDEATAESTDELSLSAGKFETFVGKDGRHYFHLLAGNGEKVLASQGYASHDGALAGVSSVQANGPIAARYELRKAVDGASYFVLKAGNGAVIGVSETYASSSNAQRGLNTVIGILTKSVAAADAPVGNAKFETFRGIDSQYYFHLRAGNGEIVLQSQGYSAKASAADGTKSVLENGKIAARYQLREASSGQFYFVLRAANGQTIAVGETYASKSNAQAGIATCVAILGG